MKTFKNDNVRVPMPFSHSAYMKKLIQNKN